MFPGLIHLQLTANLQFLLDKMSKVWMKLKTNLLCVCERQWRLIYASSLHHSCFLPICASSACGSMSWRQMRMVLFEEARGESQLSHLRFGSTDVVCLWSMKPHPVQLRSVTTRVMKAASTPTAAENRATIDLAHPARGSVSTCWEVCAWHMWQCARFHLVQTNMHHLSSFV